MATFSSAHQAPNYLSSLPFVFTSLFHYYQIPMHLHTEFQHFHSYPDYLNFQSFILRIFFYITLLTTTVNFHHYHLFWLTTTSPSHDILTTPTSPSSDRLTNRRLPQLTDWQNHQLTLHYYRETYTESLVRTHVYFRLRGPNHHLQKTSKTRQPLHFTHQICNSTQFTDLNSTEQRTLFNCYHCLTKKLGWA